MEKHKEENKENDNKVAISKSSKMTRDLKIIIFVTTLRVM